MSRPLYFFLITLFLNIGTGNEPFSTAKQEHLPSGTPEGRGAWVARRVDERETGRDARMTMRMRLFDRQGRSRERALTMLAIVGGPGRPVPGDRSLIRFTAPADIRGTGFLVWEQPGADDERFLYLPSLGRVRRIAATESQESFVGSDFTYEDISGRELDDLRAICPRLDVFSRVVAENGGVLYRPDRGERELLAPAPPKQFVEALRKLACATSA